MTGREPEVLDALLGRDLTSFTRSAFHEINPGAEFLDNWHIACVCWHLEKCYRGETKRLIITLPPRHLKLRWRNPTPHGSLVPSRRVQASAIL